MAKYLIHFVSLFFLGSVIFSKCHGVLNECPDDSNTVGPITSESLVTSYFSVEYDLDGRASECRLLYHVPDNATVYQGMIAAHEQHGENFTYKYDAYALFGHHITSINGVDGHDTTHWALHHGDTWETADFGIDFLYVEDDSLYLWRYTDYDGGEFEPSNFTGDCHAAIDDVVPGFKLTSIVIYLSVSTENTAGFVNGTITAPMCKRPVLVHGAGSLLDVTMEANDQLIVSFEATVDPISNIILSVNELCNQDGYSWRAFDVPSNEMLPADLTKTPIKDGGHYVYRFTESVAIRLTTSYYLLLILLSLCYIV